MRSRWAFVLILVFVLANCSARREREFRFLETGRPLFTLGTEDSGHYYSAIFAYSVDRAGRAFLWDSQLPDHVDVYDDQGRFAFQFGRRGQGPGEFQHLGNIAVDSTGTIWANDGNHKSLARFDVHGEYLDDVPLPKEIREPYIRRMIFDPDDELILLCATQDGPAVVYRFLPKTGALKAIQKASHWTSVSFVRFMIDVALDQAGDIYITDAYEYRLYVYSQDGRLLRTYEEPRFKKERILAKDFDIFKDYSLNVMRDPDYKQALGLLAGDAAYFPAIFGVNVDEGTVYIWTSEQDEGKRFRIDLYDKDFHKRGIAHYFNRMGLNQAKIVGGRLYLPSIENTNPNIVKRVGRITPLNNPEFLNAYSISKEILSGK